MLVEVDIKSGVTLSLLREEQNTYHTCPPTPPKQSHMSPNPSPLKQTRKHSLHFSKVHKKRTLFASYSQSSIWHVNINFFHWFFLRLRWRIWPKKEGLLPFLWFCQLNIHAKNTLLLVHAMHLVAGCSSMQSYLQKIIGMHFFSQSFGPKSD